jgi:uncharacterized membrane protein
LLLRCWELNSDLWLDEIVTVVNFMRLSPLEAASTFTSSNQHLLNSVLGSLSIRLFGESAWAVRLPAMLFGVATVPVFFCLARLVTQRREAIFSTLFLVLSYHHVWFSQNARGYSAMIFFTVLSSLFLLRWHTGQAGPGRRDWLWFSLSSSLGMLSLLNYAFVVTSQFLAAALDILGTRAWSRLPSLAGCGLLIVAFTTLGYAAILPSMIGYFTQGGAQMGWQDPLAFARVFASGMTGALPTAALPALGAGAILALTGWVSYLRRQRFIALMLVLPASINVLALTLLDFGAYPRSFLYILPFGILIMVRGAFILGGWTAQRLRLAAGADYGLPTLLLVAAVAMLPYNYRHPKQDYSGALAYARALAGPEDVIAAVGMLAGGYRRYYAPDLAFPETAAELDALRRQGRHVLVLYSFTRDMRRFLPDVLDYLESNYQFQHKFPGTLGDGTIYLFISPGSEP